MANLNVAYPVLGVYILLIVVVGVVGAFLQLRGMRNSKDKVREHFTTSGGLGTVVWFFTMSATLFSGYSVSGICNEAYRNGWVVTKWISAGVGIYITFAFMAPRLHALGKARGYMTLSQYLHDRFLPPAAGASWVGHAVALLAFLCLQLPVFTYLITQFRSLGSEVLAFTAGEIDIYTSILTAAGLLLLLDITGGMRAVAFTDVLQGAMLFVGSIVFLILQRTQLGGLRTAWEYWSNPSVPTPSAALAARVWWLQRIPPSDEIVNYFDFVAKTTLAATMFPHLTARLFAARSTGTMRKGLAAMNFSFFLVQLSSMITGWTAVYALRAVNVPARGGTAFGAMLRLTADSGSGPAFAAALLLASVICACMSTADSALLAFSSMWVRDVYARYLRPKSSQLEQLIFGKLMAFVGLSIGVGLSIQVLRTGKPDLSGLFAFQNVTPIHVTPAVWLSLHWRGLRGEAVLTGMVCGLAVTLGLLFSDKNVAFAVGSDRLANGLSSALVGFFVNFGVTVALGLLQQYGPAWARGGMPTYGDADEAGVVAVMQAHTSMLVGGEVEEVAAVPPISDVNKGVMEDGQEAPASGEGFADVLQPVDSQPLDIGPRRDRILKPWLWAFIFLLLLFTIPFYRVPRSWDGYVGDIGSWAFTSLLLAGMLALTGVYLFLGAWEDYIPYEPARGHKAQGGHVEVAVANGVAGRGSDGSSKGSAAADANIRV